MKGPQVASDEVPEIAGHQALTRGKKLQAGKVVFRRIHLRCSMRSFALGL